MKNYSLFVQWLVRLLCLFILIIQIMDLNEHTDVQIIDHQGSESQIQKMFSGSTVLLTGGTGFLGKLLIEKLLRSCPNIKKLYLLIRPKKNKDINKRLKEQFDDLLYDEVRKKIPDFIQKIGIIEGEMGHINLGIRDKDKSRLINEVNFIFHCAATVRFNETLKKAVEINVLGTQGMLKLARACIKLRAFVYISTAYSNCHLSEIDEKFYSSSLPVDLLIELVENMDENTLKNITPGLLGNLPNTYTYSKSAAEDLIRKHSQGLPIAIFRPSMVLSTANEPVPGWIDNIYGPTGVILGTSLGLIHTIHCNTQLKPNMVPGDYVTNGIIAAAWKTAVDYHGNNEHSPDMPENYEHSSVKLGNDVNSPVYHENYEDPIIYNYVNSAENTLTLGTFMHLMYLNRYSFLSMQVVWVRFILMTPSRSLYKFYCFLLHWIPAYIVDTIAIIIGKKPALKKTYRKIDEYLDLINQFTTREWKFHNKNTLNLLRTMNDADRHIFNFDLENLKWDEYCRVYSKGIRLYFLKDPLETIPQAQKKYFKFVLAHYFLIALISLGLLKLIWILVTLFI